MVANCLNKFMSDSFVRGRAFAKTCSVKKLQKSQIPDKRKTLAMFDENFVKWRPAGNKVLTYKSFFEFFFL